MNCKEIEELLYDYATKRLKGKDQELVETHLITCELCRDALHTIEKTLPALNCWPAQPLPADYSERVLKEIFTTKITFLEKLTNILLFPRHIHFPVQGLAVTALVLICIGFLAYKITLQITPMTLPQTTTYIVQQPEAPGLIREGIKGAPQPAHPTTPIEEKKPLQKQYPFCVHIPSSDQGKETTEYEVKERASIAPSESAEPPAEIEKHQGEAIPQGFAQEKKPPVEEVKEMPPVVAKAEPQPSAEIVQPSEGVPAPGSVQEKKSTPKESRGGFFSFLSGLFKPKEPEVSPKATVDSGGGPYMLGAQVASRIETKSGSTASLETKGLTAYVSGPDVKIRAGAGTDYVAVATVSKGTELTILEDASPWYWYKVRTPDGKEGWVRKDLVTLSPKPEGSTQSPLNAKMTFGDPIEANTAFALDLYSKLKTAEGNIFFSPYSISTALAMTYAGARGNTEKEMANVLHFAMSQEDLHSSFAKLQGHLNEIRRKGNIRLNVANALWAQKDYRFLKTFIDVVKKSYEAEAKNVDFRGETENVRKEINAWIEEKTENKIIELLQPGSVSGDTCLILTNAIYFKGNWASQFKKNQTTEMPFFLNKGNSIMVPMMQKKEEAFNYTENTKVQILELPYKGNDLSMVILLPRIVDGIHDLENELSTDTLNMWLNNLQKQEVEIYLPKFKSEYEMSLTDNLKEMGMVSAFNSGIADFSGMDGTKFLYISDVLHKAFVNVDEEGTEAAAATAVTVGITASLPKHIPVFRADHPFIFLIRDNSTGSILFMGRIANPKSGNS